MPLRRPEDSPAAANLLHGAVPDHFAVSEEHEMGSKLTSNIDQPGIGRQDAKFARPNETACPRNFTIVVDVNVVTEPGESLHQFRHNHIVLSAITGAIAVTGKQDFHNSGQTPLSSLQDQRIVYPLAASAATAISVRNWRSVLVSNHKAEPEQPAGLLRSERSATS